MSKIKKQQKKLLISEITVKSMEHFMGLDEKNEAAISQVAKKFTARLVKLYYQAVKTQHRKALKTRKEKKAGSIQIPVAGADTENNLLAS